MNPNFGKTERNRRHLIKMNPNFGKTENDNDMDNDIEIEPKTRHSTSISKPGEVDEHRSGRGVIKPSRYHE